MAYGMNFGLDPSALDPEALGLDPSIANDPNASWMDKLLRLKQARDAMSSTLPEEAPPKAVSIPRVQAEAENPSFFSKNAGLGKGIDIGLATLALLSNLRAEKKNKASGYQGHQTSMIDLSQFPSITGKLKSEREKKAKESLDLQQKNIGAAESEAKINESAMASWAARRNAQMGQVMPSITKAAFRDPSAPKAPPVFQQKLQMLKEHPAYLAADAATRNKMELHVLGAEPKTPQDTAGDYAKAYTRLQARLDFQKKNPGAAGGKDLGEIDIADMAKYMQGLIVNNLVDPETAADEALKYGRNKMKLREAVGKDSTFTPGAMTPTPAPAVGGAVPPGGGAPAATGAWRENGKTAGLPPDLAAKIGTYAKQKSRHATDDPQRIAAIRADIMRTYGLDPDNYLEPAPLLQPGQ